MKKIVVLLFFLLTAIAISMAAATEQISGGLNPENISQAPSGWATVNITSQPFTGVSITAPLDLYLDSNGTTNFTRYYVRGFNYTFRAPKTINNYQFKQWSVRNGTSINTSTLSTTTSCTLNASSQNYTLYAEYSQLTSILSVSPAEDFTASKNPTDAFQTVDKVYTLTNTGNYLLNWSAAANQSWVSLSAVSGSLAVGASTTITVTINDSASSFTYGSYSALVNFTNLDNGNGNTAKNVIYTVVASNPQLSVAPAENIYSISTENRDFPPATKDYVLSNTGNDLLNWSLTADQGWVSFSADSGSLNIGESTTVTVSIASSDVASFTYGSYTANLSFTNLNNSNGDTQRYAICLVDQSLPQLSVTPAENVYSTFTETEAFVPASKDFTISNTGNDILNWSVSADQGWVTLSADSGSLDIGESTTVSVSINNNAASFTFGTYTSTVSFSNLNNNLGNTQTYAICQVEESIPQLSIDPSENVYSIFTENRAFSPAEKVYTLSNTGNGILNWTASANQSWVSLSADSGSLTAGESTTLTVSIVSSSVASFTYGSYTSEISFSNLKNNNGNAQRLAVVDVIESKPELSVAPSDNLYSTFTETEAVAPASKDYTITNTGNDLLNWSVSADQSWVSLSADSGSLDVGESTTVTVSIISNDVEAFTYGSYTAGISFNNLKNSLGNTQSYAIVQVELAVPQLSLTPDENVYSIFTQNRSFTPDSKTYTIRNDGYGLMNWTASADQAWVSLSADSGSLATGESTTVTVSILDSSVASFAFGSYTTHVSFNNLKNSNGNAQRLAVVDVIESKPELSVAPSENLYSTFTETEAVSPASKVYTLANTGNDVLSWAVSANQAWVSLSADSGSLDVGESTTVTVSIISNDVASFTYGSYTADVSFSNLKNSIGNTQAYAIVQVEQSIPQISITPVENVYSIFTQNRAFAPASKAYTVSNSGNGILNWTASANQNWVSLSSDSGTLTAGESTTLTVSIVSSSVASFTYGSYTSEISFSNLKNNLGNDQRFAIVDVIESKPELSVTPSENLYSTFTETEAVAPASKVYTVSNSGNDVMNWSAAANQAWVSLSADSGSLDVGESTTVTVSINTSSVASFTYGSYTSEISFTNLKNSIGNTQAYAIVQVEQAIPQLSLTPTENVYSSFTQHRAFAPAAKVYTVSNSGNGILNWTASANQNWVSLSNDSGSLTAGKSTTLTVSIVSSSVAAFSFGSFTTEVSFNNLKNSLGNTQTLAICQIEESKPILTVTPNESIYSIFTQNRSFVPASKVYTLANTGNDVLNWVASADYNWISFSNQSGSLDVGESTTVTVSIVSSDVATFSYGTYTASVSFSNTQNGIGNSNENAICQIDESKPELNVTPVENLYSTFTENNAFAPVEKVYTVSNTGNDILNWTVAANQAWVSLSADSGALDVGQNTTVTVTISTVAASLTYGSYTADVSFVNTNNAIGNTQRFAICNVAESNPQLSVTPDENMYSTFTENRAYAPAPKVYTLANTGNDKFDWTITADQSWVSFSADSGSLSVGESTTVTVSVSSSVASFTYGSYTASLSFSNLKNSNGNTQKYAICQVEESNPQLSVTSTDNLYSTITENREFTPATKTYTLANTGNDTLNWKASANLNWATLSSDSGSLDIGQSTTITVSVSSSSVAALSYGVHTAAVSFTNLKNSSGDAQRLVIYNIVKSNPELSLDPNEDFYSSRTTGDSFTTAEKVYTLSNSGNNLLKWSLAADKDWVSVSSDSGSLDVGQSTTVTVTITTSASALAYGYYTASLSFTNVSNDNGNTDKYVIFHVVPDPKNMEWDNGMGDFEPADDTVFWAFEQPESTDTIATYSWVSSFDGHTGLLQVSCDTQNSGLKMTSIPRFTNSPNNYWKITVDYYSEASVSKHSVLPALLLYSDSSNYQIREIGASFIGMGLTPINSWQQWSGYLLSKGSPTGQLQLILKNQCQEGNLYIDKVTLSEVTAEELANPVDMNVTSGDFNPASDTSRWGYERVFSTDSGMPQIRYSPYGWSGQNQMIWGYFTPGQTLKVTSKDTFSVASNHRVMMTGKVYVYTADTAQVNFQVNIFNELSMSSFNIGAYASVENIPGNSWNTFSVVMETQQDINRLQFEAFNNSNTQQMLLFDDINFYDLGEATTVVPPAPAAELN